MLHNFSRAQCDLSCGLATTCHLIKSFDVPAKFRENLCSVLLSAVIDYPEQVKLNNYSFQLFQTQIYSNE